jgi:phosphate starvation-inducible protein PhoH
MVVTGGLAQADRLKDNGLINFIERIEKHKKLQYIDVVRFESQDIERHDAVKEVLEIYGD